MQLLDVELPHSVTDEVDGEQRGGKETQRSSFGCFWIKKQSDAFYFCHSNSGPAEWRLFSFCCHARLRRRKVEGNAGGGVTLQNHEILASIGI